MFVFPSISPIVVELIFLLLYVKGNAMGFGGHPGGNMHQFSTKDRDNDDRNTTNCAQDYSGGWWYGYCRYAGINEVYRHGTLYWEGFQSTNSSKLMIRRT